MSKTKETYQFKDMPTVVKISEIPTGVRVLRINLPFTLRHLAQKGVQSAWINSSTSKSISTFLKEDMLQINEWKDKLRDRITELHPSLKKRIGIIVGTRLSFGGGSRGDAVYVKDIPRLQADFDSLGISNLPLRHFMIPLEKPKPTWALFQKRKEAFICTQIGSKMFHEMTEIELMDLIAQNPILQRLNAYVCETIEKIGKWLSCKVPTME